MRFRNGANARGYEARRELMDIGPTRGEIDYVASTEELTARHPVLRMNV